MAVAQPQSTDQLNSPSHSTLHRIIAADVSADVKAITVDSSNNIWLGDGTTNYTQFDANGFQTMAGDAQGLITLRPNLIAKDSIALGKPTQITRGCNIGYSMPIWNSGTNNDEELYFRMRIPVRWDGTTDPQFTIMTTLIGAEDVGDKFKFQLEWQTTPCGGDTVMGVTTSSCTSEQTVLIGGAEGYTAYCIYFTLDTDDATNPIIVGEMLQGRLRRIASAGPEVTQEIGIWDWVIRWKTNKVFGTYSTESNAS